MNIQISKVADFGTQRSLNKLVQDNPSIMLISLKVELKKIQSINTNL